MVRSLVYGHLLALPFALVLACGGSEGSEECTDKCLQNEAAVLCNDGLQNKVVCGASPTYAALNCEDSGGLNWAPIAVCFTGDDEGGESSSTSGGLPWAPERHVTFDAASSEWTIEPDFIDSLKDDPNQLAEDDTVLRSADSGHYQVAEQGALAAALGWQSGDVLLSVDDYEIQGLTDYVEAYAALADNDVFELTVLRGGEKLIFTYRVE